MFSKKGEQALEVESLKVQNEEGRLSIKAVFTGVGSVVGLVMVGFIISSFRRQPAKADSQSRTTVMPNLANINEKVLEQPLEHAPESKHLVEPLPPAGRVARMNSLVSAYKAVFIFASVITAVAVAGAAYYLVSKWQFDESITKQAEKMEEMEAAIRDKQSEVDNLKAKLDNTGSEINDLVVELNNERLKNDDLREKSRNEQLGSSKMSKKLEYLQSEVNYLEAEFKSEWSRFLDLKAELKDKQSEITNLKAELEDKQSEISTLSEELSKALI
jgi:hypothetical protein